MAEGGSRRRRMRLGATALAALSAALTGAALAGCAPNASLSDRIAGASRVRGDGDQVSVFQAATRAEAYPLAIGHCARFGRSAQFYAHRGEAYVFRCVKG